LIQYITFLNVAIPTYSGTELLSAIFAICSSDHGISYWQQRIKVVGKLYCLRNSQYVLQTTVSPADSNVLMLFGNYIV